MLHARRCARYTLRMDPKSSTTLRLEAVAAHYIERSGKPTTVEAAGEWLTTLIQGGPLSLAEFAALELAGLARGYLKPGYPAPTDYGRQTYAELRQDAAVDRTLERLA